MKKTSQTPTSTANLPLYCQPAKGILMAIGGNEDKGKNQTPGTYRHNVEEKGQMRILSRFCELTGKQNPKIAVITTASTQPEKAFPNYKAAFKKLGLTNVQHVHDNDRKAAVTNQFQDILSAADAIIFSGGDQLRLTSIYG